MDWFDRAIAKKYLVTILVSAALAFAIRSSIVEAYRIPSNAMKPTLLPGDVIFGYKPVFGFRLPGFSVPMAHGRPPRRGEIVIFQASATAGVDSIRRVVGLPGERIALKNGKLILNGQELAFEPDANSSTNSTCGREHLPDGLSYSICLEPPLMEDKVEETVPDDSVFLLSDLRQQLSQSQASGISGRNWVLIPVEYLKARATMIWLSIDPEHSRIRRERMFTKIR